MGGRFRWYSARCDSVLKFLWAHVMRCSHFLFAVAFIAGPGEAQHRAVEEVGQVPCCVITDNLHLLTGLLNVLNASLGYVCDAPLMLISDVSEFF